ncbi:hypothetical protein [Anaerosalibacter massiliensis]|uniref:Uncharacterized protein n=1 Tax=Anaerosalibacter massiliensis TaxID=1347392 RepID=A0A9X2S6G3_9FIRM|nr:hypothetical protein [Anaerosalibacter massiliensis]MCR2045570.1 hypothetical protein [Anaerosalibacter massiliensis]
MKNGQLDFLEGISLFNRETYIAEEGNKYFLKKLNIVEKSSILA